MITEILDGYTQLTFDPASWPNETQAVHWVLIDRESDQLTFPGEYDPETLTIESHHAIPLQVSLHDLLRKRVVAFWVEL